MKSVDLLVLEDPVEDSPVADRAAEKRVLGPRADPDGHASVRGGDLEFRFE
jgi:hypothetical protein